MEVENYQEWSKLFWKNTKNFWNKREGVISSIRTLDGNVIKDDRKIEEKCRERFKELLNAGKVNEHEELSTYSKAEIRSENMGHISKNEIIYALQKMFEKFLVFGFHTRKNAKEDMLWSG